MLIISNIYNKRKYKKIDKKQKNMIHNHEVEGSIPPLATRESEVYRKL